MRTLALPELHLHLDGSLRPSTLDAFAREAGQTVPVDLRFRPAMGLAEALSRFAFTLGLLQTPKAVRQVASELCEDERRVGVTTLELRFAPQLHRDGSLEAIVDAALEGTAGRAGLILCGLYGEDPAVLGQLVEVARTRPGVVGIDLAGGPSPAHAFSLHDYAAPFARARDLGLGRTVHAGEGRPPEEIRVAIEVLHAQRIGHGSTLLNDERVTALVLERGVTLEACPTSNVHTGVFASVKEHPLARWLARGVRACICADNSLLSGVSTADEVERARTIEGMTPALLDQAIANGHAARFVRR